VRHASHRHLCCFATSPWSSCRWVPNISAISQAHAARLIALMRCAFLCGSGVLHERIGAATVGTRTSVAATHTQPLSTWAWMSAAARRRGGGIPAALWGAAKRRADSRPCAAEPGHPVVALPRAFRARLASPAAQQYGSNLVTVRMAPLLLKAVRTRPATSAPAIGQQLCGLAASSWRAIDRAPRTSATPQSPGAHELPACDVMRQPFRTPLASAQLTRTCTWGAAGKQEACGKLQHDGPVLRSAASRTTDAQARGSRFQGASCDCTTTADVTMLKSVIGRMAQGAAHIWSGASVSLRLHFSAVHCCTRPAN